MNQETKNNKTLFEEMPPLKALAVMAVPTVISQLIILIYNMADTFFLGKTNNPYMVAGASLILPIFNVSIAFANIAGTGGGTLIARLLGKERTEDARRVASFSFWYVVLDPSITSPSFSMIIYTSSCPFRDLLNHRQMLTTACIAPAFQPIRNACSMFSSCSTF